MDEYDSGPFCRHWGDPSDCEAMCQCGHKCCEHSFGGDCKYCDCENFEGEE